jgi:GTP:adenosylcobinamide-phosphate guanylyltransferase
MQVVILAAGRGKRFAEAGYAQLKPLIPVCGVPMITHVLQEAQAVSAFVTILCPTEIDQEIAQEFGGLSNVGLRVLGVRHTQSGAACTLLAAAAALNEDEPVLVVDCDSIIDPMYIQSFAAQAKAAFYADGAESALLCFKSTDGTELWSFVGIDPLDPLRVTVREKIRISDIATCGVHAFKSWAVLRAGLCRMISSGVTYNKEFYLAPIHNGLRAAVRMMPDAEFHPIGTPAQLEAYERSVSAA